MLSPPEKQPRSEPPAAPRRVSMPNSPSPRISPSCAAARIRKSWSSAPLNWEWRASASLTGTRSPASFAHILLRKRKMLTAKRKRNSGSPLARASFSPMARRTFLPIRRTEPPGTADPIADCREKSRRQGRMHPLSRRSAGAYRGLNLIVIFLLLVPAKAGIDNLFHSSPEPTSSKTSEARRTIAFARTAEEIRCRLKEASPSSGLPRACFTAATTIVG